MKRIDLRNGDTVWAVSPRDVATVRRLFPGAVLAVVDAPAPWEEKPAARTSPELMKALDTLLHRSV